MSKKDEIVNKIINIFTNEKPTVEIYLYGSRARGDFIKTSDWDFLVLLDLNTISFNYETKIMDSFYDVELETGEILSPLIYSKKDWITKHCNLPLFENIKNEGIRIK
ncbi:MAG: nucleotidyltransferase domain-containing protein [Bacteroidales bacterium]|nr:nucleotidyltransferase domain-containing protein [Bacteroidales bacterium]